MKCLFTFFIFICSCAVFGQQWQQTASTPAGGGVTDMLVSDNGTLIVATASFNYPSGQLGGIRRSTNEGQSWQNPINCYVARTLEKGANNYLYASYWEFPSFNESIYRSTDDGSSWSVLYRLSANDNIFSIAEKDSNGTLFIGTRNGILRSTNSGVNWVYTNTGIPANSWVRDLEISPEGYIAAATTNGLFISLNNGDLWQQATGVPAGDTVVSVSFTNSPGDVTGSYLLAGTSAGVLFRSMQLNYLILTQLSIFQGIQIIRILSYLQVTQSLNVLAGRTRFRGDDAGIFISSNKGNHWTAHNLGLPPHLLVSALALRRLQQTDFKIYCGFYENSNNGAGIYSMDYSVGINNISSEIPENFRLEQNYPNPFNPLTKIRFSIPEKAGVNITTYDFLGKEVSVLVNEPLPAGVYEIDFDGSDYTSGVYFYRMTAGNYSQVRKMILVK